MELLTKQVKQELKKYPLYSQDGKKMDAICPVKFFHCGTGWTWYVLEADLSSGEFFGIVCGIEVEYGYFTLQELESIVAMRYLRTERDSGFKPTQIGKINDPRLQDFLKRLYPNKDRQASA